MAAAAAGIKRSQWALEGNIQVLQQASVLLSAANPGFALNLLIAMETKSKHSKPYFGDLYLFSELCYRHP